MNPGRPSSQIKDDTKSILDSIKAFFEDSKDVGTPEVEDLKGQGTERVCTSDEDGEHCSGGQQLNSFTPHAPVWSVEQSRIGPGSCPAPRQIDIMDKTYSFEFDPICGAAEDSSVFLMALAYLIAIRIVFTAHQI